MQRKTACADLAPIDTFTTQPHTETQHQRKVWLQWGSCAAKALSLFLQPLPLSACHTDSRQSPLGTDRQKVRSVLLYVTSREWCELWGRCAFRGSVYHAVGENSYCCRKTCSRSGFQGVAKSQKWLDRALECADGPCGFKCTG